MARTILPCQDTPCDKFTYNAQVNIIVAKKLVDFKFSTNLLILIIKNLKKKETLFLKSKIKL